MVARTRQMVREVTDGYEQYLTVNVLRAFEAFVDDLSNWYIRRSRRRFWDGDEAALRTLWSARWSTALRVVSPIMPFLTEHLWQVLVARACPGAPDSVFLAGWPELRQTPTTSCSRRSPRCGGSSSWAARRGPRPGSSCASRCGRLVVRGPRERGPMSTRSPTSSG